MSEQPTAPGIPEKHAPQAAPGTASQTGPAPAQPTIPPAVPAPPPAIPEAPLVTFDEFARVQLRTAEILEARPHPKADRLLLLRIKVGEQQKQIVAGIRQFYTPEQLVGRTIIVVNNLQPARLRGEDSFGMLLAVRLPDGSLRLLTTDGPAPDGLTVS